MEAFPDGGFFTGKNFVFDERVTVGLEGGSSGGTCLVCSAPHDTYEPRRRCRRCRMLVLVCPACAAKVCPPVSGLWQRIRLWVKTAGKNAHSIGTQ